MFISRKKTIETLKNGGLVALKSDTIYGLSCQINAKTSLRQIYCIKKRSLQKSLIVLFDSLETLQKYIQKPKKNELYLMQKYWPGPLTLILKIKLGLTLDPLIQSQDRTIAARIPASQGLINILKESGPIVSSSINLQNQKSLHTTQEIRSFLDPSIGIYRGAESEKMAPASTIFCFKLGVLREGSILEQDLTSSL